MVIVLSVGHISAVTARVPLPADKKVSGRPTPAYLVEKLPCDQLMVIVCSVRVEPVHQKAWHCVRFSAHGAALQRQTKRSISAIDAAGASRTRLIAIALFSADPCSGAAPLAGCAA